MKSSFLFILGVALVSGWIAQVANAAPWPQWGGPSRDFAVPSDKLADKWPEDGPPKLWSRTLGDGYSSIIADGELLFTMYRPGRMSEREFVVALDAASGKIVWEHGYECKLTQPVAEWGHGPNSTPLIARGRLYAIDTNAIVRCLDKANGKVLWKRDLVAEFSAPPVEGVGYCSSPIAYKDTLIVPLGYRRDKSREDIADGHLPDGSATSDGRNRSVLALSLADGKKTWESAPYVVNVSSPTLITHGGQEQLLLLVTSGIVAIDPNSGDELWRTEFEQEGQHIMMPVWDGRDLLFVASQQDTSGGRAIQLNREHGKTIPKEIWFSRKIRTGLGTPIRIDNNAYVPGDRRLLGLDLKTGKRHWSKGGFESASCLVTDGKLILLDQNGKLTLATPSPKDLVIHAQCQITERYSFSCPTLVGRTLYIRDRKNIMALDVGMRTQ